MESLALGDGALSGQHDPKEASDREVEDTPAFMRYTVEKCRSEEGDPGG